MKIYAIIKDALVINTIIIDPNNDDWVLPDSHIAIDVTGKNIGVGFNYDKDTKIFTNPAIARHEN
ncbi:hypothetical protein [Sodalis ligni]|uniref:Uncharacterized protein n=1 Tax=Sodalis ligni TaxID=2697027 RepID=A0A4R1NGI8_9GAMM|nr:hypothetical protein [Sodalis ligni]TCL06815.1 hypothetical protein EZJ58_5109 [Sodalis ligni]